MTNIYSALELLFACKYQCMPAQLNSNFLAEHQNNCYPQLNNERQAVNTEQRQLQTDENFDFSHNTT